MRAVTRELTEVERQMVHDALGLLAERYNADAHNNSTTNARIARAFDSQEDLARKLAKAVSDATDVIVISEK